MPARPPLHTAATWQDKYDAARRAERIALHQADAIITGSDDPSDPWAAGLRLARWRNARDLVDVWADIAERYAEARDSASDAERVERRSRYAG